MWLALQLVVGAAHAGVWVRDEGQAYAQAAFVHAESGTMFLADGTPVAQTDPELLGELAPLFGDGRYASNDLSLYAEYGLGHGFELDASLPLRYVTNRWSLAQGTYPDIVQQNLGLGDLTVAARLGTVTSGWALSAAVVGRAPVYSNAPRTLRVQAGNSDFEDDRVPLGPGTFDLGLDGGIGWGSSHVWALIEGGITARNRSFSAVVPGRVQLGVKPIDEVAIWLGADGSLSLGNGAAPDFFRDAWGKGPIAIDNQRFVTASAGALVEIKDGIGVIAGFTQVLAGARFPRTSSGMLGVTWSFDVKDLLGAQTPTPPKPGAKPGKPGGKPGRPRPSGATTDGGDRG